MILKEAHDKKLAKASFYVTAAELFLKKDEFNEAKKLAVEILNDLSDQLDSNLCEKLGDIFLALEMNDVAKNLFDRAQHLLIVESK